MKLSFKSDVFIDIDHIVEEMAFNLTEQRKLLLIQELIDSLEQEKSFVKLEKYISAALGDFKNR